MCGVVDNNVSSEVFGDGQTGAGKGFRDWLDRRGGSLAVGGDLLDELDGNGKFKEWYTRNDAERQSRLAACVHERALDPARGPEPWLPD